jgi:hypothetical protein
VEQYIERDAALEASSGSGLLADTGGMLAGPFGGDATLGDGDPSLLKKNGDQCLNEMLGLGFLNPAICLEPPVAQQGIGFLWGPC